MTIVIVSDFQAIFGNHHIFANQFFQVVRIDGNIAVPDELVNSPCSVKTE